MSNHFTVTQEGMMVRLRVMQETIAEQELHAVPCPVLYSQLQEMEVFAKKLVSLTHQLKNSMKEHQ